MQITDIKINGITKPLGFDLPQLRCSFRVRDTASKAAKSGRIEVSRDAAFTDIVFRKEGEKLDNLGERLDFSPEPMTRYFVRVTLMGDLGDVACGQTWFETGRMGLAWPADWIGPEEGWPYHPDLHTVFRPEKPRQDVESARLYVTGVGLFEAWVNGQKAGDEYLAPFLNDYKSGIQLETYDVTEQVRGARSDDCRIDIFLGNGWYKGRLGYGGQSAVYGDRFAATALLRIRYTDGSVQEIRTDETWMVSASDIAESDIYDGEVLCRLRTPAGLPAVPAQKIHIPYPLVDRYSLPLRVREELPVKEIIHTPAGETVLDMGQNFTGFIIFDADFESGTKILFEYGEVLQQGNFYRDNYRTAKARFLYISDGRKERVRAHFTFCGFRYVRVTGWPEDVSMASVRGAVLYSDLEETGRIETSDPKVNRLFQNCLWGQKCNFVDIPSDCPQRDERLGWTGDAQVFAPTASFNMDTRAFYGKYLRDLHAEQQRCGGAVPAYIPMLEQNAGSSVWGDAATFIPMTLYRQYGDICALREQYPMMKEWVDWITQQDEARGTRHLFDFGFHFGDWLALDGVTQQSMKGGTEDEFVASAYYYRSAQLVAQAAGALGKTNEAVRYTKLADEIRAAFLNEYFTATGRLAIDTQTAYLLCLRFGLYTNEEKLKTAIRKRLKKDCFKIRGGFVGATTMCTTLAEHGMADEAWNFLLNEEYPGWLHCVNLGATTIWERWNSLLPDGSISGTGMNSLNHYAYGSVVEFLYRDAAGIRPETPGFSRFILSPLPDGRLKSLACRYESPHGTIVSEWRIQEDGQLQLHFEVPFGTTARIVLPYCGEAEQEMSAGKRDFLYRPTKDLLQRYTEKSTLQDMRHDEEALAVLEQELPIAYGMARGDDPESLSLTMEDLSRMTYLGFEPEQVKRTAGKLAALRRQ